MGKLTTIGGTAGITRWQAAVLWFAIASYGTARICQFYADRLPVLLIVLLHVVPPAVFALMHASLVYRLKGALVFTLSCLGVGGAMEVLSLRTGFPFGHYYFTDVMGPKLMGLPFLLVLAYLGIGYCAWALAVLLAGVSDHQFGRRQIVFVPALAAFIMLAWDLSMEADWSTIDRAWIWRDGGRYFGVPLTNFCGWYLTAYAFYQIFAIWLKRTSIEIPPISYYFRRLPVLMYAICALGNLFILKLPMAPTVVTDASGHGWSTMRILWADSFVSIAVMLPLCIGAWIRAQRLSVAGEHRSSRAVAAV